MDGVYAITVEVLPTEETFYVHGGAYINVFTTDSTEAAALATARREVTDAGWAVKAVTNVTWVTRRDYADNPTGLEYFEQALIDGVVLVVHSYPPDSGEQHVAH
jgi:hypothetical protein